MHFIKMFTVMFNLYRITGGTVYKNGLNMSINPVYDYIPCFSVHWHCIYLCHRAFMFVIDVIIRQTPEVQYVK